MGSRNKPFYRLVAADSRFATTGRFLELLGWYDPKQKDNPFSVNVERVDYWLGNGAQVSATAASLIKKARAGEGVPVGTAPKKKAPATPVDEPEAPAKDAVADEPASVDAAPAAGETGAPADDASEQKEA